MSDIETTIMAMVERAVAKALAAERSYVAVTHVTVADFAKRRSISTSTVRAAIKDGRLESTKIGRAVRIPYDAEIRGRPDADDVAWARRKARLLGRGGR